MKKIKGFFILIITLIVLPITVNAAGASISVKTSGQAIVGNTITANVSVGGSNIGAWQFIISYDSSKLQLVSGQTSQSDTYATNPSKSYTLKFKVLKSGSASINVGSYLVYAMDDSQMSVSVTNATVKAITQAELEASYSKNNNLKSISVGEYELSPEFNKDTLEYTVKVPSTVDTVEISATKEDSTASVDGIGSKEVVEGSNPFDIVVTAQNGSTKTYKLNVIVEDLNPIELQINGKDYTVVKRADNLEAPKGFEATTITIGEVEVPAYKSELLSLTVVGIKDKDGKISYATYDDGKYELYMGVSSNSINLYIIPFKEEIKGFIKTTVEINGVEIDVYKLSEKSEFAIVRAKNVETGDEGLYVYDLIEKTFQRYDDEEILNLQIKLQNYSYIIIAFAGCLGLLFFCLIIYAISRRKAKRKLKRKKEEFDFDMTDSKEEEVKEIVEELVEEKKKNNKKKQK